MADGSSFLRAAAGSARVVGAVLGAIILLVAVYGLVGELVAVRATGLTAFTAQDAAVFIGVLAAFLSGGLLVGTAVPRLKIRLPSLPAERPARPVYGFTTILAIGIGSTLGSPLFLLIPVNVVEYGIVSVLSLILATILSVAMARNNADSYRVLRANGIPAVGGPAFVRVALGARSARYFISRFSMAVANTALAAYCVLVFILFVFGYLPTVLAANGLGGLPAYYLIALITVLFAAWFVMNSIFERRFIRAIGLTQLVFTTILVTILVVQSLLLGSAGGWDFRGLFAWPAGSPAGWIGATIVNTAYLYLLFFGFQEIQALDRESRDTSRIPILSRVWPSLTLDKRQYFTAAMILTVVIAAAVNLFYALAVFVANPSASGLSSAQIPAVYVATSVLGEPQGALTAIAFLLATFTTFVPSFLAATRHIGSLGEDGFLPRAVTRGSWLFVLASIALLAAAGQDFLVNITDYMVLVSLGVIAFAAIWLRRDRRRAVERGDGLAIGVGLSCFLAAAALYVVNPAVAVFGSLSIAVAFLIYDLLDLGTLGTKLFLAVVDVVTYVLLSAFPRAFGAAAIPVLPGFGAAATGTDALRLVLLLGGVVLITSFAVDVLSRTGRLETAAPPTESGSAPASRPPG